MKKLSEIVKQLISTQVVGATDVMISSIEFDSRKVSDGTLFVAFTGTQVDGHSFIDTAIEKGAMAILCEKMPENCFPGIAYIQVGNTREALALVASYYYGHPSRELRLVGVTGTNGKTSIATLLYSVFRKLGYKTGLLSTVANYVDDIKYTATHTTPDSMAINHLLKEMVEVGCDYCFMEVSSHAIDQYRTTGLDFDGGIFTNLTRDHLDYHGSFAEYRDVKKRFFDQLGANAFAITNKDDKNGLIMVQNTKAKVKTYAIKSMADYKSAIIERHFNGMLLTLDGAELWVAFAGDFNASNLLAVYAGAVLLGQRKEDVLVQMSTLEPVDGRFETIRSNGGVNVIVDYAHTPDALKNVLETIAKIRTGKEVVYTVVGAGGNRDKGKRPLMAREALMNSDQVFFTSDNPRFEEPDTIIRDMMVGMSNEDLAKSIAITDRFQAIKTVIMMAKDGDVILIAGKGHEDYQDVKGVKHHFDDREVVRELFNTLNK